MNLKKLISGPADLVDAFNRLVKAVQNLGKMHGTNGVRVQFFGGIPMISGGGDEEYGCIFKTPPGGIPARSGDVPGSATCDIYYRNSSAGFAIKTGETRTIYNFSNVAFGASKYGLAKKINGDWYGDSESCS